MMALVATHILAPVLTAFAAVVAVSVFWSMAKK
jgi:hypothetical protein